MFFLILAGGCLDHALAIEFAREARCLALLDVQKKPLNDLKHSLQQIYGKEPFPYLYLSIDLNALKYTITAICEELTDNISVLVNCAATAHFNNIPSHTDDEYQYFRFFSNFHGISLNKGDF
ncbi:unnamed protein product [Rotaria sp. Silwood2]|nr:unnamed protein product [Rotaria sp. Silwood2]